jgi:hypothetical protein
LPLLVQHEKIGEKKTLCIVVFSFEVGQTSILHNFIVDFRIEKVWYHGFFSIFFYIKFLRIYFQKIIKLLNVYILKKLISPFFVECFFCLGQKILIKQLIA